MIPEIPSVTNVTASLEIIISCVRQSNLLVRTACATRDMSPKIKKASERKNIWKLSHFARSKAGFGCFSARKGLATTTKKKT